MNKPFVEMDEYELKDYFLSRAAEGDYAIAYALMRIWMCLETEGGTVASHLHDIHTFLLNKS